MDSIQNNGEVFVEIVPSIFWTLCPSPIHCKAHLYQDGVQADETEYQNCCSINNM